MGGRCSSEDVSTDNSSVTDRDKKMVTDTWYFLHKHWEKKHGPAFFVRLFKKHPDVKTTFKTFAHLSDEELLKSSILRAHVLVFGTTVCTWVDKLQDEETLVALIQKNTDSHVIRGITDSALFKTALLELLEYMTEAEGLKPAQVRAWRKIANLITCVIEERIKDYKA